MATIETRRNRDGSVAYRAKVRLKGVSVSETFSRKTDAREWAARKAIEIQEGRAYGTVRKTLDQAIERYLREELPKLAETCRKGRRLHLEWWREELGGNTLLTEIQRPLVQASVRDLDLKYATRNRYRAALGALLSCAVEEWHWLPFHPLRGGGRRKRTKGEREEERDRVLTPEERDRLWSELRDSRSSYLYALALAAYYSGGRQGELLRLRWRDLDLFPSVRDHRTGMKVLGVPSARAANTKNGTSRTLYFPGPAGELLREMGEGMRSEAYIFSGDLQRPVYPRTAFEQACRRARVEDFRFHDFRHCWATHLAEEGATLTDLMVLGGWRSPVMVRRYASKAHAEGGASLALMERLGSR